MTEQLLDGAARDRIRHDPTLERLVRLIDPAALPTAEEAGDD